MNLNVTEIYKSLQGEAGYAGFPCVFIRLTGCPLRCRWCDTAYGFEGGKTYALDDVLAEVKKLDCRLVELTGGEPLAQEPVIVLMERLLDLGYDVLLETGGSESIANVPKPVHVIMDLKCPDSKMQRHNLFENLGHLKPSDEIKFVIASRKDFDWMLSIIDKYNLTERFRLLASPAFGLIKPIELAEWILESQKNIRFNLQQHKYIWSPKAKGV